MHNDWKKLFNSVIDSNLLTLQQLEETDKNPLTNSVRTSMTEVLKNLRHKIDEDNMNAADIMTLSSFINIAHARNKTAKKRYEDTVNFYEKNIIPELNALAVITNPEEKELKFTEIFNDPIV